MDNYLRHLMRRWLVEPANDLAVRIANAVVRSGDVDNAPPAYLAVGFKYEDGLTFSLETHSTDPRVVYRELCAGFGYTSDDYEALDEILLIENGEESPDVRHHWSWKHWERVGESNFVDREILERQNHEEPGPPAEPLD